MAWANGLLHGIPPQFFEQLELSSEEENEKESVKRRCFAEDINFAPFCTFWCNWCKQYFQIAAKWITRLHRGFVGISICKYSLCSIPIA